MNAMVLLAVISVVGAAALFVALALFLRAIDSELETIGGPATRFKAPANFLAKIRLGVRAIERQTDALAPQVTRLNGGLSASATACRAIDGNPAMLIASVSKQARTMSPSTVPEAVYTIWWTGLIVTLVVFVPLAVYSLHRTWRSARSIQRYAAETLQAAGGIARNTANITALDATIAVAGDMLGAAGAVERKLDTVATVLEERCP